MKDAASSPADGEVARPREDDDYDDGGVTSTSCEDEEDVGASTLKKGKGDATIDERERHARRVPSSRGDGSANISGAECGDVGGDDDATEVDDTPTATAVLVDALSSLVNQEDVGRMRETQLRILANLQDSNAVLGSFNDFCDAHLPNVADDLALSAKLVRAIKTDLAYIHKHSR